MATLERGVKWRARQGAERVWPGISSPKAILRLLDLEQGRLFYWLPVFIGLGIGIYFTLPFEPGLYSLATLIVFLTGMIFFAPRTLASVLVLSALVAAGTGFVSAKIRTEWVRAPKIMATTGPVEIEGWVERIEERASSGKAARRKKSSSGAEPALRENRADRPTVGHRITMRPVRVEKLENDHLPKRIRLYVKSERNRISVGDYLSVSAILRPPPGPSEPGGYDFARRAWYQGLGAVGYTRQPPKIMPTERTRGVGLDLIVAVEKLRADVAHRIGAHLNGTTAAITTALLTGARGAIPENVKTDLRHSGLAHILAISGLHMAIMSGAVFWLVRAGLALSPTLALTRPIKKWSAIVAMLGAAFYLALSGASPATQRAFFMVMLLYLSVLLDRPALSLRNVAIAALFILILWPESLLNISFQMSFAAVTALIAFYETWNERQSRTHDRGWRYGRMGRSVKFLIGIALTTIIAGAAIAPFAAFHFNKEAGYSLLANMLAMPVFTLVTMPMALMSLMAMPFGLEALPLTLMSWSIEIIAAIAARIASLPGAVLYVPQIPISSLLCVVLGAIWLMVWRQRWRYLGLTGIAAGLALAQTGPRPDILVGDNARTVAVRNDAQKPGFMRLSATRGTARSYVFARWLENDGDARAPKEAGKGLNFRCDRRGCVTRIKGLTLALTRHPSGLNDDCAMADIVIVRFPVKRVCESPRLLIDPDMTRRDGVHAVYMDGDKFRIETVEAHRGRRPWTRHPAP